MSLQADAFGMEIVRSHIGTVAEQIGQPLDERLQLGVDRRRDAPEHRRLGSGEMRTVEHEHMEMNIEIEC